MRHSREGRSPADNKQTGALDTRLRGNAEVFSLMCRSKFSSHFFNNNSQRAGQPMVFLPQRRFTLDELRVDWNAGHWANLYTLRSVKMTDAFGAFIGVNFVDVQPHIDRLIRAFGFAHVAIDAFVSNQQSHIKPMLRLNALCSRPA